MVELRNIYVITMWSGGRPAKKWHAYEEPEVLASGNGVAFTSVDSKLKVSVIGSISVEQFESGREEFEEVIKQIPGNSLLDDSVKLKGEKPPEATDTDTPLF